MNYINDENTQCTEAQARKLVSILQEWGWEVEYGTSAGWSFNSDSECDDFHNAFGKAFNLATIAESGVEHLPGAQQQYVKADTINGNVSFARALVNLYEFNLIDASYYVVHEYRPLTLWEVMGIS